MSGVTIISKGGGERISISTTRVIYISQITQLRDAHGLRARSGVTARVNEARDGNSRAGPYCDGKSHKCHEAR